MVTFSEPAFTEIIDHSLTDVVINQKIGEGNFGRNFFEISGLLITL